MNIFKKIIRRIKWILGIHSVYGKIYLPQYNMLVPISKDIPDIYNKQGNKMDVFFIRDRHFSSTPNECKSKYFIFDRYNFGLDTHFYTHTDMLKTMGKPSKKYGLLCESEAIVPKDYQIFEKYNGLEKEFDLIFTFSDKILNSIPNARFFPFSMMPWVFGENDLHLKKNKNISIIASGKARCEMHSFRNATALKCKNLAIADAFGKFCGGVYFENHEPFFDYRFSVVIENDITSYYFTEKITNCFATMTIPVYLGATKISEFFNPDGIIAFSQKDDIEQILKKCTKEEYEAKLPAVIDNYNRINNGNPWDKMYEEYFK